MVPAAAVAFISILHWPQVLALFGISVKRPDWGLRLKSRPLPWCYTAGMLAAQVLLEWLPYIRGVAADDGAPRSHTPRITTSAVHR